MKLNDLLLLSYDIKNGTNRTACEEWRPHKPMSDKFIEWHYWTSVLYGSNGHKYFLFLCDFNLTSDRYINEMVKPALTDEVEIPKEHTVRMLQAMLIDYETENVLRVMEPAFIPDDQGYDYSRNAQLYKTDRNYLSMGYKGDVVTVDAKFENFGVKLNATGGNRVMWAQDGLNKKGLIRQGAPDDFSFYYSLPNLPFNGVLEYEENGKMKKVEVVGRGWIDRQWGDYMTKSWEWASMRFDDGDRINLYNFAGGYQTGSYMNSDGQMHYFDNFKVIQKGYSKCSDGTWFSYGWAYKLPVKDKFYTVEPLSDKSVMIAIGNSFYEGLGRIINEEGEQVGWCVNESMDTSVMENGPFQKFQFNE